MILLLEEQQQAVMRKIAYLKTKRRRGVITAAANVHCFAKGEVVDILHVSRGTFGNTGRRRSFLIYEAIGKNPVTGNRTRQTIFDSHVKIAH